MSKVAGFMHLWMLPMFGLFVVGWLVGGGYLLRNSLHKHFQQRRPPKLPTCVLGMLLAGGAGVFSAAVTAYFFYVVAKFTGLRYWLAVPGGVVALILMVVVAFLVLWARYGLSIREAVSVAGPPVGGVMGLLLVLGLAVGVPGYFIQQTELKRKKAVANLQRVYQVMEVFEHAVLRPPKTLREMVDKNYLEARELESPALPDREVAFFYLPTSLLGKRGEASARRIVACEYGGGGAGSGRAVLLVNGECEWQDEDEFQAALAEEPNAKFAQALQAAEGS